MLKFFQLLLETLKSFTKKSEVPESHEKPHSLPAFEAKRLYDEGKPQQEEPKPLEGNSVSFKKINKAGLDLLKQSEGLMLRAYRDSVGVLTIGYGHTGSDVKEGQSISLEEAERLLREDLLRFEKGVEDLVKVPLNDNQFSSLVVFSYNVGLGNFMNSTLLKKLNNEDYVGAAQEFPRWNKAGGKVLNGLTKRRNAERALFLSPV